jgi:hypothetical protein
MGNEHLYLSQSPRLLSLLKKSVNQVYARGFCNSFNLFSKQNLTNNLLLKLFLQFSKIFLYFYLYISKGFCHEKNLTALFFFPLAVLLCAKPCAQSEF